MVFVLKLLILTIITIKINAENVTNITNTSDSHHHSHKHRTGFYQFCDINKNCTKSTVCIDNRCVCKPNHKWNKDKNICQSYNCQSDRYECNRYDPNRVCKDEFPFIHSLIGSNCVCTDGYREDRKNFKCRKECYFNSECATKPFPSDNNNMTCVDTVCQCRPNFRWNSIALKCEHFECRKDSDCWGNGDDNRECDSGICVCNYSEDIRTKKCYLSIYSLFVVKNYHSRKEALLFGTIFIIPGIMMCCLYSYYRKRKVMAKNESTVGFNNKDQQNVVFNYPEKQKM